MPPIFRRRFKWVDDLVVVDLPADEQQALERRVVEEAQAADGLLFVGLQQLRCLRGDAARGARAYVRHLREIQRLATRTEGETGDSEAL